MMKSYLTIIIVFIFSGSVGAQNSPSANLSAHMPKTCDDRMLTELYNEIGLISCWSSLAYSDRCQQLANNILAGIGTAAGGASALLEFKERRLMNRLDETLDRHKRTGRVGAQQAREIRDAMTDTNRRQIVSTMLEQVSKESKQYATLSATRTIISQQIRTQAMQKGLAISAGVLAGGGYLGLFVTAADLLSNYHDIIFTPTGDAYDDAPYSYEGKFYFDRVKNQGGWVNSYEIGPKVRDFLRLNKEKQMDALKAHPFLCEYYRNVTANMKFKRHKIQNALTQVQFLEKPRCSNNQSQLSFKLQIGSEKFQYGVKFDPQSGTPQENAVLPLNSTTIPPYIYKFSPQSEGHAEITTIVTKSAAHTPSQHTVQGIAQLATENPIRHRNVFAHQHRINYWTPLLNQCCRSSSVDQCFKMMGLKYPEAQSDPQENNPSNNGEQLAPARHTEEL